MKSDLFLHQGGASDADSETSCRIFVQVVLPFLIAGCGMVGAGLVLDIVQHWPVFVRVSEIFILVPALLGLKGNLEMTLASRLSTLVGYLHVMEGFDRVPGEHGPNGHGRRAQPRDRIESGARAGAGVRRRTHRITVCHHAVVDPAW